jgi:hypothetical protein
MLHRLGLRGSPSPAAEGGAAGSSPTAAPAGNGGGAGALGRPLRLVYCDEKGKFVMDPEAVAALQLVKGPVGVVSVCGRARQGKSFVLNQVLPPPAFCPFRGICGGRSPQCASRVSAPLPLFRRSACLAPVLGYL